MLSIERLSSGLAALASRAVSTDVLQRLCRGVYIYPHVTSFSGPVLYHTATRLRANTFNYLRLESVLSDVGVTPQLSRNWITLMSFGRSSTISIAQALQDMKATRRSLDLVNWAVAKELGA